VFPSVFFLHRKDIQPIKTCGTYPKRFSSRTGGRKMRGMTPSTLLPPPPKFQHFSRTLNYFFKTHSNLAMFKCTKQQQQLTTEEHKTNGKPSKLKYMVIF